MIISRSIHVAENGIISFFFMAEIKQEIKKYLETNDNENMTNFPFL